MLPRWHILLGFLFTAVIWFFVPNISYFYLSLIFLSSFLIDFDHYVNSVLKTGDVRLGKSLEYHRKMLETERIENLKGIRRRGDFHLFHTVEFHALIGFIGLVIPAFFYIFVGMIFHSLLDVFSLIYRDRFYRREYFFFNWFGNKIRKS